MEEQEEKRAQALAELRVTWAQAETTAERNLAGEQSLSPAARDAETLATWQGLRDAYNDALRKLNAASTERQIATVIVALAQMRRDAAKPLILLDVYDRMYEASRAMTYDMLADELRAALIGGKTH